jgi:hypothetical protein
MLVFTICSLVKRILYIYIIGIIFCISVHNSRNKKKNIFSGLSLKQENIFGVYHFFSTRY